MGEPAPRAQTTGPGYRACNARDRHDVGKDKRQEVEIHVNAEYDDGYYNLGYFLFLKSVLIQKVARNTINPGWILLGNQSIADVFSNPQLVKNIRHARGGLHHDSLQFQKVLCHKGIHYKRILGGMV